MNNQQTSWVDNELDSTQFADKRLGDRYKQMLNDISNRRGDSLPTAFQDWARTKAAYRALNNPRIAINDLSIGHFKATAKRAEEIQGYKFVLHDTTEFLYNRKNPNSVGLISSTSSKPSKNGSVKHTDIHGFIMHHSLLISEEGLPLGSCATKFFERKEFKKNKKSNKLLPIEEKESLKWLENLEQSTKCLKNIDHLVHIGDRECDIFEFYDKAIELNTNFIIRSFIDRSAQLIKLNSDSNSVKEEINLISNHMENAKLLGIHVINIRDKKNTFSNVSLEIKVEYLKIYPPKHKKNRYKPFNATVIYATEINVPKGRDPIVWHLLTNLPTETIEQAIQRLNWYGLRWRIETFFKILKSGCRVEDSRLETTNQLARLIALCSIISWRIFWITMINRSDPHARPELIFTKEELEILDSRIPDLKTTPAQKTLSDYVNKVARLGGYLNRKSDPPPGPKILWRGLKFLAELSMAQRKVKKCG